MTTDQQRAEALATLLGPRLETEEEIKQQMVKELLVEIATKPFMAFILGMWWMVAASFAQSPQLQFAESTVGLLSITWGLVNGAQSFILLGGFVVTEIATWVSKKVRPAKEVN